MEKPEGYKLLSAGRNLQRTAEVIRQGVEKITGEHALATKAVNMVEANNMEEVGNWLVKQSGLE